jgi:phosphate transport system substrate-binding protein
MEMMMNNTRLVIVLVLFALVCGCKTKKEDSPTSGKILMAASESQSALMQSEIEEFHRLYPDAVIDLAAGSTREAIVLMLNDSIRFICTDRRLNDEELAVASKAGLQFHELRIAEDALAFIVNKENPATQLSTNSIVELLTGKATSWSMIPEAKWPRPVALALTGRNSGTYELLTKVFLKSVTDPRPNMEAASQAELVKYVATTPGAFGVVGAAALRDSSLAVKAMLVEARDSTTGEQTYVRLHQANIYRSRYPYHYPVYLYSTAGLKSVAAGFTSFIAGNGGQKIVQSYGLAPATVPVRLVQLHQE